MTNRCLRNAALRSYQLETVAGVQYKGGEPTHFQAAVTTPWGAQHAHQLEPHGARRRKGQARPAKARVIDAPVIRHEAVVVGGWNAQREIGPSPRSRVRRAHKASVAVPSRGRRDCDVTIPLHPFGGEATEVGQRAADGGLDVTSR